MVSRERERCRDCGFDSDLYDRADTITSQAVMPAIIAASIEDLDAVALATRTTPDMWSIGEYLDHVREVAFGNRFLIEVAKDRPGSDVGEIAEPPFAPEPRSVDVTDALSKIEH